MRELYVVVVLTIGVSLFWGCADYETPTAPQRAAPEFLATIHIDSCKSFPSGQPLDELCGGSSDIRASFDFVLADIRKEYTYSDHVTQDVIFRTGPGTWEFLHHGCTRRPCRFSDALHGLFEGRPLTIIAMRSISPNGSLTGLSVHVIAGNPAVPYDLSFSIVPVEMSIDAAGFPVIDGDMAVSGSIRLYGGPDLTARGSGDVKIKNWHVLSVHHKPEPPVVARPTFNVQELRDAPETLEFGEYKLAFQKGDAYRPALDRGITAFFSIWEQGLWDFDQARLDFLWVVHESGEVWEPEIPSAWDSIRMERSASDGPEWEVGTEVDVVAGFVDLNGDVWLMRITDTIELSF
jgi:hypothetical protein